VLSTIFPKDAKRGNGRLEMVSKLLEFTISRHAKTPYDLLVRKYCPSETAHSTYSQVETLFKVILRRVLAWDLLGSTHNWDLLFLYVGKFVRLRKFELLRLDNLINSLRVTDIAWLAATNRNERMCRAEFEKRRQLLGNVVSFIFQNFIPTFLKANFYATEMGADSNSVFYFRHDVWSIREQQVLRSFISSNLQPVPRKSASGNSVFTRVVPKPDGSGRVITKFKAANEHLKLLQTVLKQTVWDVDDLPSHVRYQKNPHTFAAKRERPFYTIRALRDFLPRLESFRRRIMAGRKVVPPVFIVKTDISRCYDTLNRDMALDNADSILRRADAFWLYRFKMFNCRVLSPKYYGRFESIARYDDLSLDDVVHGIAKARALSIIIDNQPKELLSSAGLSSVLEAHLNKTTVRINRRPFKHIKGVPQGSCVSSVLCDIVYDAFLREHMKFDARTTILFRYVDDFLLISTDLNAAESFLSAMTNGFPEYGVHINPAKTVTNFAPHLERPNGTSDTVNFLGIGIEVRSLLPVFRVLESRSAIASSLSYGGGPAGHVLASKITRYLSHRLHRHSTTLIRLPEHRRLAYCCNICRNIGSRVSLMVRLWFRFVNPVFLGRVLRWCISRVVLALRASSRPSISKSSTRSIRWACIKGFECELQSPKFESTLKQLRGFYS
jgi:hemolysin-activating ACP:hemolysin acyltransferase